MYSFDLKHSCTFIIIIIIIWLALEHMKSNNLDAGTQLLAMVKLYNGILLLQSVEDWKTS